MPRKAVDENEILEAAVAEAKEEIAEKPYAKQFWRYINPQGIFFNGAWPMYAVDEYLEVWRKAGYKLHTAFPLDKNPEGVGVFYVMVLDE